MNDKANDALDQRLVSLFADNSPPGPDATFHRRFMSRLDQDRRRRRWIVGVAGSLGAVVASVNLLPAQPVLGRLAAFVQDSGVSATGALQGSGIIWAASAAIALVASCVLVASHDY